MWTSTLKLALGSVAAATIIAFADGAAASPSPGTLQRPPQHSSQITAAERAAVKLDTEPASALADFDALLATTPDPSPFRGGLQVGRAQALVLLDRFGEAAVPVEEALRLLPGKAFPKLLATHIYTYTGNISRAADLWLQASQDSAEATRKFDIYSIDSLLERLDHSSDRPKADLIRQRLVEINYTAGSSEDRSERALAVIRHRLDVGDVAGARAMVSAVTNPADVVAILIDRRYEVLWPAVSDATGDGLNKRWASYVASLKAEWTTDHSFETSQAYIHALRSVNDDATVAAEFLPLLAPERIARDDGAEFYAAPAASALAALGRRQDAIALLQRLLAVWPPKTDVRGLNVSGNLALRLLIDSRHAEALATVDQALADAKSHGSDVNGSAVTTMHMIRACAAHGLSRDTAARDSVAFVEAQRRSNPEPYLSMLACLGKSTEAKAYLIKSLDDEDQRDFTLRFVQTEAPRPSSSMLPGEQAFDDALRSDPDLRQSLTRYGRILPYPVSGVRLASAPH